MYIPPTGVIENGYGFICYIIKDLTLRDNREYVKLITKVMDGRNGKGKLDKQLSELSEK